MGTKLSPVGSSQSGGGSIGPTTPTDFTEGSVIFAGADYLAENNAAFKWDQTAGAECLNVLGGSAAARAVNLDFPGFDAVEGYTTGMRIRSTSPTSYYPRFLVIENGAYGVQGQMNLVNRDGFNFKGPSNTQTEFVFQTASYELVSIYANGIGPVIVARPSAATQVGHRIKLATAQTANAFEVESSGGSTLMAILAGGGVQPASMADGSAPNNSIYYSTTASKLVYKDAGGVVNALY